MLAHEQIQDQRRSSPTATASNQHYTNQHDNQPLRWSPYIVKGEGATTNNNINLPLSQIDASYRGTQQYSHPSSRTRSILHRGVHLFHYTFCSTGPMEAARSFLNMPLMNGARSMLIYSRLTTSCNEDEDGSIQTYILHCQPYSSHQDNVLLELQIY